MRCTVGAFDRARRRTSDTATGRGSPASWRGERFYDPAVNSSLSLDLGIRVSDGTA
jgi:hypothetical protein